MQQTDKQQVNQNEETEAKRDQLAENLAFLIVQSHRHDQQLRNLPKNGVEHGTS
ncbi:hypothetical protein [Novipirellula rosea]|uniref:hypothetical protein n=1 Tax=Novipirellula rosea TaxID=1031540 RepID=UPI0031E64949